MSTFGGFHAPRRAIDGRPSLVDDAVTRRTGPAALTPMPLVEPLEPRVVLSTSLSAAAIAAASATPPAQLVAGTQPAVTSVSPKSSTLNVALDSFVSAEVALPNGGIDPRTITADTVYLERAFDGERVPAVVNTSGAGDVIVLKPISLLQAKQTYTFVVTEGVTDINGVPFTHFQSQFKTGVGVTQLDPQYKGVRFTQVPLATSQITSGGEAPHYLGITIGPDHQLYASTNAGLIFRWPILSDGTLGTPTEITTIRDGEGPRYITGIAFDPASTADNPVLWVTHCAPGLTGAPDLTGKLTKLSGSNLQNRQDVVINLPRSARDHLTEQPVFGPDGAIYFCQASNSSLGAPDVPWGNRPEHLLNASILRLDPSKVGPNPVDALTKDVGGTYDPFAANAPLTIYAEGVRNAYDMVWANVNGTWQLYAPGNGSAVGGNAPAGGGAPALTNVPEPETDYLFHIVQGGYYGHPNPEQGHFVVNGGNPTAGLDPYEESQYPVGTQPDPAWIPAILDMGQHESPDGVIQYEGNAFNGALNGKLLICRESGGDDVVAVGLSADGSTATSYQPGIPGLAGFADPLDLCEDKQTGNVYVAEYAGEFTSGKITLLRVPGSGITPTPTPTPPRTPKEQKLIARIQAFDASHGLPAVDLTTVPGDQLKGVYADEKFKVKILNYAQKNGFTAPDLSQSAGAQLKTVFSELQIEAKRQSLIRKVTSLATRKKYPLPDVSAMTIDQLKSLIATVKHSHPT